MFLEQKIYGERIYLKKLTILNATEEYCGWLNDPEVNIYLETRECTTDDLKKYIKKKSEQKNCLFLGIYWKENDKHIGTIKLEPIDYKKSAATMGIMIGDKNYWGKGVGGEAVNLLTNYAFQQLGLKEMNLGVMATNQRALRLYEKCGFKVYEIEKNALNHDGKLFDNILMKKINLNKRI